MKMTEEYIKPKSTLEGVRITRRRADGNTTRQVDAAIQYLFLGYTVLVQDHHGSGLNKRGNEELLKAIITRLELCHGYKKEDVPTLLTPEGLMIRLKNIKHLENQIQYKDCMPDTANRYILSNREGAVGNLYEFDNPRGLREGNKRPNKILVQVDSIYDYEGLKKHIGYLNTLLGAMELPEK